MRRAMEYGHTPSHVASSLTLGATYATHGSGTGARPSSYDYALISMAAAGWASLEDALAQAAKRRRERSRAAARQRAGRAKKTNR